MGGVGGVGAGGGVGAVDPWYLHSETLVVVVVVVIMTKGRQAGRQGT